jgi:SnoaL-like domain
MSIVKSSALGILSVASLAVVSVQAQELSPDDRAAIQDLSASYARTLADCRAEEYADLFVPKTGYFASGFRGRMVGREQLVLLVQSERHCTGAQPARPGGGNPPTVELEATPAGARGVAHLGMAEYQDEYRKTAKGWRFASRTVILAAEKAAGLDAREMLAIQKLGGTKLGDYYEPDPNGVSRLLTSGVRIGVTDDEVTGRAFLKGGGYNDEVYEKLGPGNWRVTSSKYVPPEKK